MSNLPSFYLLLLVSQDYLLTGPEVVLIFHQAESLVEIKEFLHLRYPAELDPGDFREAVAALYYIYPVRTQVGPRAAVFGPRTLDCGGHRRRSRLRVQAGGELLGQ